VSRADAKPWIMLKPETEAVIDPREIAARALVERCPMDTTGATTNVYSSM